MPSNGRAASGTPCSYNNLLHKFIRKSALVLLEFLVLHWERLSTARENELMGANLSVYVGKTILAVIWVVRRVIVATVNIAPRNHKHQLTASLPSHSLEMSNVFVRFSRMKKTTKFAY